METQSIQNLLTQISAIIRQYDKIAELSGENFNVFKVLGLTTNEVRTHSAFIAELLNPNGSHGKKETFLHLFIQQMQIKDFISENAVVKVEKHIGYITADYSEGGNIDIIVTDKNNRAVIIENKIYAGDQQCQLWRYFNYGKKNHTNSFDLLYLTLDGKDACEGSKIELKEHEFKRISYSFDILEWLEKCKEKAVNHPILRETITQYIFLIKYLTGQTTNNVMKEEIVTKIASDKEYITTLFTILKTDLISDVKKELINKLKGQVEAIANELKFEKPEFTDEFDFKNSEFSLFTLYLPNSKVKKYYINFMFFPFCTGLIYGIGCEDVYKEEYRTQIAERLGKGVGFINWVWLERFENPFYDWNSNYEPWLAIIDDSMKKNIKEKIENIMKNLEGFEL